MTHLLRSTLLVKTVCGKTLTTDPKLNATNATQAVTCPKCLKSIR